VRRLALLVVFLFALATPAMAVSVSFRGTNGRAEVKPRSLWLTGDGTLDVFNVHWTSWGGPVATGAGLAKYHGCTPDCARGRQHQARVTIRLGVIRTCSGTAYYSKVSLYVHRGGRLHLFRLSPRAASYAPC
jgi:hypothetical protein